MSDIDDIRAGFLDRSAAMAQAEGLPPICGRIFGLLVFDGGPISFADLAAGADVSRASISTGTRILEERGLIRRFRLAGQRGDMFDMTHPPYRGLLAGLIRRARQAEGEISATIRALPADEHARRARLEQFHAFHGVVQNCAAAALEHLTGDSGHDTAS